MSEYSDPCPSVSSSSVVEDFEYLAENYEEQKTDIYERIKKYQHQLHIIESGRLRKLLTDTDKEISIVFCESNNTRAVCPDSYIGWCCKNFMVRFWVGAQKQLVTLELTCSIYPSDHPEGQETTTTERYTTRIDTDVYMPHPLFLKDWFSEKRIDRALAEFYQYCRSMFDNDYEDVKKCVDKVVENLNEIMF